MIDVNAILSKAKQIGASDAHFIPGIKPTLRINRDLVELDEYENISKEDILKSLEYIYENEDVELEEYDKEKIVNEAEKIVYENLYNKLNNFKEDKPILKNEIDNLFKELEEKYKIS